MPLCAWWLSKACAGRETLISEGVSSSCHIRPGLRSRLGLGFVRGDREVVFPRGLPVPYGFWIAMWALPRFWGPTFLFEEVCFGDVVGVGPWGKVVFGVVFCGGVGTFPR